MSDWLPSSDGARGKVASHNISASIIQTSESETQYQTLVSHRFPWRDKSDVGNGNESLVPIALLNGDLKGFSLIWCCVLVRPLS